MGPCQHRWPSEALMLTRAAARSHPDLQRPRRRGLSIAAGSRQIRTHRVVRAKATSWEPHSVGEASKGMTGPFPHCSDAFGIGHRRLYMYNTIAASRSPTPCALRRAGARPGSVPDQPSHRTGGHSGLDGRAVRRRVHRLGSVAWQTVFESGARPRLRRSGSTEVASWVPSQPQRPDQESPNGTILTDRSP